MDLMIKEVDLKKQGTVRKIFTEKRKWTFCLEIKFTDITHTLGFIFV